MRLELATTLAPSTIALVFRWYSTVFGAAIGDGLIRSTPRRGVKLPKAQHVEVVPLETAEVEAVRDAVAPRWQAAVMLAAGTGLRQGEVLGLTVDRVDFLRRSVRVDRQLVTARGQAPCFGPVKTAASVRSMPLPQVIVDVLARHLAEFPAGAGGFVFTLANGAPVPRQRFSRLWRAAADGAGLEAGVGFRALRQSRLGHASAAETLDTYSHLWPDSEDETRAAVDGVLGAPAGAARTAGAQ